MNTVAWEGPPMPGGLAAALRARGVRVVAGHAADVVARLVYSTSATRLPKAPADGRWIWVSRGAVSDGRRTGAILRGAYDVVDIASATAADDLAARVEELAVP